MININKDAWSQIFAQASFSYIIDNSLQKDRPLSALLSAIEGKSIDCFLISILNSDPKFINQSILQILSKKNAKVQVILDKYSLFQIMEIFAQTSQFIYCFWINEVKTILKSFCWLKFDFNISNSLSINLLFHLFTYLRKEHTA